MAEFCIGEAGDGWWQSAPSQLAGVVVRRAEFVGEDGSVAANVLVNIDPAVDGADLVLLLDDGVRSRLPDGRWWTAGLPAYLVQPGSEISPGRVRHDWVRGSGVKVALWEDGLT